MSTDRRQRLVAASQPRMLVRERLLTRLRERWFAPITVVSAPAGYGKTTLLVQAAAANEAVPLGVECWLSCEPAVAAASSLGARLCQAVGAKPAAGLGGDATTGARVVIDAVWRLSPRPVCLIIDDVHELAAGSEAAQLLEAVIASLPTNGHVVLSGRGSPPVRLARLVVAGQVVHLDETDLTFTDQEMDEFAAMRGVAGELVAGSGGWPAMAELLATAREGVIGDYVGEEVLAHLPVWRRRQLGLLSRIGWFDDGVASAVLGSDVDVAEVLADLPLLSVDAGGGWSMHSLWASLLAGDVSDDEVAEAQRRAGLQFADRGQLATAIHLLVEARAWDDFTDAIAVALGVAHPPVARDVLTEWFARLPVEVRSQPGGLLLQAVLSAEADSGRAWRRFSDCAAAFGASGHTAGQLACLVQLGQIAWWNEDPDALAEAAGQAFELEAAGCVEAEPLACLGRGLLFDIANDSRNMLIELDRILPATLSEAWWGIVCWARAIGLLELGQTGEAQAAAEQALVHAELIHSPLAETTRLQSLWYAGQTSEVLDALPGVLDRISRSGFRNHIALVASQCSVVDALYGELERGAAHLAQARAAATMVADSPLVDTNLSVAEAALAVASQDEAAAAKTLEAHLARRPVRQGIAAAPQQRHLALFYVLVPATRPVWDSADLGPAWAFGRALAQAVVALRQGRVLPTGTPALAGSLVQAHLPPPWVAELAVAAIADGRDDGWRLLDQTWPITYTIVVGLSGNLSVPARQRRAARDALKRLPALPTSRLELRLLGPVQLLADGEPVEAPEWRRQRVRSLLTYLALHRSVSRWQLADDLWPDLDPEAQARNLRVTLTYLLRVVEPARGQRNPSFFVRQHGDLYTLEPGEWLTVDLWEAVVLRNRAVDADRRGAPAEALDHSLRAVELWRDEPTELADPWASAPLEQCRLSLAETGTRAGELLLAQGDVDRALALAERALTLDPWREASHRLLVAAYVAGDDRLAARRALKRYRDRIDELGIAPDEATTMVERLLDSVRLVSDQTPTGS